MSDNNLLSGFMLCWSPIDTITEMRKNGASEHEINKYFRDVYLAVKKSKVSKSISEEDTLNDQD